MKDLQGKSRGVPNKQALYQQAAYHAPRAIEVLVEAINEGENYAVRVGAAKALLSKVLPDLKSQDLTGLDGKSLIEKIVIQVSDGSSDKTKQLAE